MDVLKLQNDARAEDLLMFVEGIVAGESNRIATLANIAAVLYQFLPTINWVGFYLQESVTHDYVLGPFMGKPACTRIPLGKGVVGTAAQTGITLRVPDVHQFSGHIACDADSLSEIVVPVVVQNEVVALIDVDSPIRNRFSSADQELLQTMAHLLERSWAQMTDYEG